MMMIKALSQLPSKRGNTVLEGALVLGILAVIVSGGIMVLSGQYVKANIMKEQDYLQQLAQALRLYYYQYGQWPVSLSQLKDGIYVHPDALYENYYHYVFIGMNNNSMVVTKPLPLMNS